MAPAVPNTSEVSDDYSATSHSGRNDGLYERHAKPLEADYWGEYVAVSIDGQTFLGSTVLEVAQAARTAVGPGNAIFKVGERVVGKIRSPRIIRRSIDQLRERPE
jgi:hypothetical protein